MRISIRNFRRCERADLEGAPLILVAGGNGNGKSSILNGVALLGVGAPIPDDRRKADAATLILHGQDEATVMIDNGEGVLRASYPKAEIYRDGNPAKLSTIAAGLDSICDMSPAQVAQELGKHIDALPTLDDVRTALLDLKVPDATIDALWKVVEKQGWDAAHKQAQETGTKLKGRWEDVTGRKRWGVDIGASWHPEKWDDLRHPTMKLEDAQAEVKNAEQALETVIAGQGADSAVVERLTRDAAGVADATKKRDAAAKAVETAEAELEAAQQARDAIPLEQGDSTECACPHCGGFVLVERIGPHHKLKKSETVKRTDEELKQLRMQVAEADGLRANKRTALNDARSALNAAGTNLHIAEKAAAELAGMKANAGGRTKADVDAARSVLDDARFDLDVVTKNAEAHKLHNGIRVNLEVTGVLAPGGLRSKVLNRNLAAFNEEHIAPLTKLAGWPAIEIKADMTVSFGGITFRDLGESHRWIARVVVQVAIARLDKSSLSIIDRADVLDLNNRNRLFGMLAKSKTPALVGMTSSKPDPVADLAKMGFGASYWIRDGITVPLADAKAA